MFSSSNFVFKSLKAVFALVYSTEQTLKGCGSCLKAASPRRLTARRLISRRRTAHGYLKISKAVSRLGIRCPAVRWLDDAPRPQLPHPVILFLALFLPRCSRSSSGDAETDFFAEIEVRRARVNFLHYTILYP